MKELNLEKEKGKIAAGFAISILCILFSFFVPSIYNLSKLTKSEKIFQGFFVKYSSGRNSSSYLQLACSNNINTNSVYKMGSRELNFTNLKLLEKIKRDEKITIYTIENELYQIMYKGSFIVNTQKANLVKEQIRNFLRYTPILWIILIFVPLKNEKWELREIIIKRRKYILKLDIYYVSFITILTLTLCYITGWGLR